eukprot:TRINITY_DN3798_c0_g1_i7.p1 TRINITY_DN3798_c0_g1~~TRINITY_DN3798_c0_g1_i7.p1  ORF type:complete len:623 (+),score=115.74 TRINITY_DN3798_c0_g1_i7:580-2448(+)
MIFNDKKAVLRYVHSFKEDFTFNLLSHYGVLDAKVYKAEPEHDIWVEVSKTSEHLGTDQSTFVTVTMTEDDKKREFNIYEIRFTEKMSRFLTVVVNNKMQAMRLPPGFAVWETLAKNEQRRFIIPLTSYGEEAKVQVVVHGGAVRPSIIDDRNRTTTYMVCNPSDIFSQKLEMDSFRELYHRVVLVAEEDAVYEIAVEYRASMHYPEEHRLNHAVMGMHRFIILEPRKSLSFVVRNNVANNNIREKIVATFINQNTSRAVEARISAGFVCDPLIEVCDPQLQRRTVEEIRNLTSSTVALTLNPQHDTYFINVSNPSDKIEFLSMFIARDNIINLPQTHEYISHFDGMNQAQTLKLYQPISKGCLLIAFETEKEYGLLIDNLIFNGVNQDVILRNKSIIYACAPAVEIGFHYLKISSTISGRFSIKTQSFATCDDIPHNNILVENFDVSAKQERAAVEMSWSDIEFSESLRAKITNLNSIALEANFYMVRSTDAQLPWSPLFVNRSQWPAFDTYQVNLDLKSRGKYDLLRGKQCKDDCRVHTLMRVASYEGRIGNFKGSVLIRFNPAKVTEGVSAGLGDKMFVGVIVVGSLLMIAVGSWWKKKRTSLNDETLLQPRCISCKII